MWKKNTNKSKRYLLGWNRKWAYLCLVGVSSSLLGLTMAPSTAQAQDTISYYLGTQTAIASQDYLPHWITANRFGILDDSEYAVGLLRGEATYKHQFTSKLCISAGVDVLAKISYTAEQSPRLRLQQGYVDVRYGIFTLSGGRQQQTLGSQAKDISTGSLSLSGNARPIPQIMAAVPEYSPVPFTKGWAEFKGTFAHGWLGRDRFVYQPYLHSKSLYLRLGGAFAVNIAAGIVHNSIWGGELNNTQLPSSLRDYWDVIFARSADESHAGGGVKGEIANAIGDNMGLYDLSLLLKTQNYHFLLYHQTPFEDESGNNPFNKDRLLGMHVISQQADKWLQSIVYEFVSTKYQSGPSRPGSVDDGPGSTDRFGYRFGGRDNYYNNYLYKTGWVYQDRVIGTPLFFTQSRARLYIPDFIDPDKAFNFNIVNNRIVAHHIGAKGQVQQLTYRTASHLYHQLRYLRWYQWGHQPMG